MSERDDIVKEAWERIKVRYKIDAKFERPRFDEWHLIAAELAEMVREERAKARGR